MLELDLSSSFGRSIEEMALQTINLLPAEQLLRQLMLDCRNHLLLSDPVSSPLEIWFTGGWVRDKLLGIPTSDIDAALSTMTGVQFGAALRDFFAREQAHYTQAAHKLSVPPDFKGLHQTVRKPERSKHLATGIARVFGLDVDLVNLREETYAPDSRTPQMRFGTAAEDAFRRDATVNALFYNLDTQQVEDFTGRGLRDLAAGIIRTPLDPQQTFTDDPLRVLRVIRFASKLGYTIDGGALRSMKDERIHAALNAKISRERVGAEVAKMMNGRNPLVAFQLVDALGLYSTVFLGPTGQSRRTLTNMLPHRPPDRPWPSTWHHAYRVLAALLEDTTSLGRELARSADKGEDCWTMAAYAPMAALRRTNLEEAVTTATEAIKATKKTSKLLEDALRHMDDIQSTVGLVAAHHHHHHHHSTDTPSRSTVGMAIRSWGATWRLQVLYALLAEVVYDASSDDDDDGFFAGQLGGYSEFMEFVLRQELQDARLVKPILDGNDVLGLFQLDRSGAFVKTALDGVVRWQFDHRDGTRDEALEWLRTQKEAFGLP